MMSDRLLIDTNLLLVMIIGAVDEGRYIERSKRLGQFCAEDYYQLWEFAGNYKEVWITPYIAAEVSNLIDLDGYAGIKAFEFTRELFAEFKQVEVSISEDCRGELFIRFGLTDNSIIKLAKDNDLDILTNDHRMLVSLYDASPEHIVPYIPIKSRPGN
ncbi:MULTISPECIES: hypothetical protein [unclassified Massilia]|uniref:hypothetical protein n=1 Tax=unclassified Massilia TaxID=2609279 RepID=UPI00177F8AAF|nr:MULTISPECIES: hypothetical protein [unclassified Massilia]MBD8533074.1 hypothetical protein [Massilia sp. CFBP 13647]MBD8676569.1 hypothetical protein [Massilia sp. CFBP 13721]